MSKYKYILLLLIMFSCEKDEDTIIVGCMDLIAENYNENANTSCDECCQYILGCMDELASNYNMEATIDDGSCIYLDDPFIEVVVFLSETCPIAQYMTLPLKIAYEEFASDTVQFKAYFPNLLSTEITIADFVQKYNIPFLCIDDNDGVFTTLYGATVYSEVFIKLDGVLIYKGMIDDSYSALGQWSPAQNNYLYNILEQIVSGVVLNYMETEAIGCLI